MLSVIDALPTFSRAFVPAVLLGESESKVNDQSAKTHEQPSVSISLSIIDTAIYKGYINYVQK